MIHRIDGIRRRAVSGPLVRGPRRASPSLPKEEEFVVSREFPQHDSGGDRKILITESREEERIEEDIVFRKESAAGDRPPESPVADWFIPRVPRAKNGFSFVHASPMWMGMIGGVAFVLVVVLLASTVFARVVVEVKPRIEGVTLDGVHIIFDTAVSRMDPTRGVIPAERLEFSLKVEEQFTATGQTFFEEKSRGKVKIYNGFSSSPQPLVAGTRFLTSSGVLFRLPRSLTVPGAKIAEGKIVPQSVEIELVADAAGEQANISGEVSLRLPAFKDNAKYDGFSAVAPAGFSGGLKKEAKVISAADLTKAEERVTKQAIGLLERDMAEKIPSQFTLVQALREMRISKVEAPTVHTKVDQFTVKAQSIGRAFVFRKEDVVAFLEAATVKGEGRRAVIPDSLQLQYQARSINFDRGKAEVALRGSLKTKRLFEERELAELLKGKKEGSLLEALKGRSEFAAFSVSFFPPWMFTAPQRADKIKFVVE